MSSQKQLMITSDGRKEDGKKDSEGGSQVIVDLSLVILHGYARCYFPTLLVVWPDVAFKVLEI